MKYMLLVYLDENCMNEAEREQCYADSAQLTRELHEQGKYLGAGPLHPTATATSPEATRSRRPQLRDGASGRYFGGAGEEVASSGWSELPPCGASAAFAWSRLLLCRSATRGESSMPIACWLLA